MRQQLLEGEPALRRVAPLLQLRQRRIGRRPVQVAHGVGEQRQLQRRQQLRRQPLAQTVGRAVEPLQRGVGEAPPGRLVHTLGGRVDRCERLLDRRRGPIRHAPVLRVDHLEARRPAAHLAEAAQTRPAHERLLLSAGEVKEAQHDPPGAVRQLHEQGTPAPELHLRVIDGAFDDRLVTGAEGAQRADTGAVLVAQRQVEQHVLHRAHPQAAEALGVAGTDALERRHRQAPERALLALRSQPFHPRGPGARIRGLRHSTHHADPTYPVALARAAAAPTTSRATWPPR